MIQKVRKIKKPKYLFIENLIKPTSKAKSSISGLYKNINGGDVFDEENGNSTTYILHNINKFTFLGQFRDNHWFFENARRDKIQQEKDDSFMNINFQNVYEMEGILPPDGFREFEAEDESEILEPDGSNELFNNVSSNSPSNQKVKIGSNPIETNNVIRVSISVNVIYSEIASINRQSRI